MGLHFQHVSQIVKGPHYLSAARLTFAALLLHVGFILVQVVVKRRAIGAFKLKRRETPNLVFDRYQSDDSKLLAADRIVGNYLEWMPVFIGMVWLYAFYVGNPGNLGWIYVLFRCLYAPLSLSGAVHRGGVRPAIYLSTVPQYLVLMAMAFPIGYALFVPYGDLT